MKSESGNISTYKFGIKVLVYKYCRTQDTTLGRLSSLKYKFFFSCTYTCLEATFSYFVS